MTRVHEAYPDKNAYWTEGGPEYTDPGYLTDWAKWSATFAGILRNWARSITAWNLALDEKGKPNIGPFACGGVVAHSLADQGDHAQRPVLGARPLLARDSGAARGASIRRGAIENVSHVGFSNPDGTSAMVLTNAGPEKKVRLSTGANDGAKPPCRPIRSPR